ncbi:O-antigen ligase [mine drainage metagenome]|uniref:O-antigen ligase n=1 Tax=mine drainage metagenome TaxID=410659 RepID=A0A1J5QFI0_9ZZZZ
MNPARAMKTVFLIGLSLSGFWYIGSALTGLLLLLAMVAGCRAAIIRNTWQAYALSSLMLADLAWLFIVALSSHIPDASMMMLAVFAGLPVMYLVASNTPDLNEIWQVLRSGLFLAGVGLAAWAIWQVAYHVGYGQAVGPLIDRNAFAALMNLLWFPAAYLFLTSKSNSKRWTLPVLATGLFIINTGLFATASRGGIASWLLLLPVLLWAGYRHPHSRRLVAKVPLIALLAYLCSAQLLDTSVADRTYQLAQDPATQARLLLWKSSLQMALAHPITGTGWGTFSSYYPAYRSPLENSSSGFFAHNDYLQLAAEGGVPALLLQLGVLLGVLLQLKRSLRRVADAAGLESVALLLGVLALFMHAVVNFIFYFAFMNILAGLFLARAAQLTDTPHTLPLPGFEKIGRPVKSLLAGLILLLVAAPFGLHLIAHACLAGTQPGLKAIRLVAPHASAYEIAKLITAIRPQDGIAQEFMLQVTEHALEESGGISMRGGDFQREILDEALARFDAARALSANNPGLGVREARILITYHTHLDDNAAYAKAQQILNENLQANPYHAGSMIMLARLQVAEGRRAEAISTLQNATHHILSRRDHQLITVEILRQLAAPRIFPELDVLEKRLHQVRSDSETEKPLVLPADFSQNIDARLEVIAAQLQQSR